MTLPKGPPSGLRFVPVIRLSSFVENPFNPTAVQSLQKRVSEVATDEVQFDMDCPARLLGEYAHALKLIHGQVKRLSSTALVSWIHSPFFEQFESSVDELVPMFYDTEIDPPVDAKSMPLPLVESPKLKAQLAAWSACAIPWKAGLPNFSRITEYSRKDGLSRGHVRDWSWDQICFNPKLVPVTNTQNGTTLLRATDRTLIGNSPVQAGDLVGLRWPDRDALASAVQEVERTKAVGIVYFRLPDSSAPSGWSLKQLQRFSSHPSLSLTSSGQTFVFKNCGDSDLEPRFSGANKQNGYVLEVAAPEPIFREAMEGDFQSVTSDSRSISEEPVSFFGLAKCLRFQFSCLRAGESLSTGVIQLTPDAKFTQIQYRILTPREDSAWKRLDN